MVPDRSRQTTEKRPSKLTPVLLVFKLQNAFYSKSRADNILFELHNERHVTPSCRSLTRDTTTNLHNSLNKNSFRVIQQGKLSLGLTFP